MTSPIDDHYHAVASETELAPGEMKKIQIEGQHLLLVHAEGEFFAVDEMCSHEDYSLALGCIQGKKIKCSLHGSYFDLVTGNALIDPADEPIQTYPVKVDGGQICVKLL